MKKNGLMALMMVVIMLLAACGSDTDDTLAPLEGVERENKEDKEDGYKEVDVADSSDDTSETANETTDNETETDTETDEEAIETESVEVDEDSKEESEVVEEKENDGFEQSAEEEVVQDEYEVLDLTPPADPTNYTSGLLFIRKESDVWRVVDRTGRVLRVFSSYDGAEPGIVNNGASVEIEGNNPSVSLIRDYTNYDNAYILETAKEDVAEDFSVALLEAQKKMEGNSKIENYKLKSAEVVETMGKGILKIKMVFDVTVPAIADSAWTSDGALNVTNIDYDYTLYGHETTWILPVKEPLYNNLDVNHDSADNNVEEVTEEDTDNETEVVEDADDTVVEQDETATVELTPLQVKLGEVKNKTVLYEKTLLPQSDALSGTNMYEHNVELKILDNGTMTKVVKGEKNGVYKWIAGYDNKAYLFNIIQPPSSEVVYSGISMVNVDDSSYRTIYNGEVSEGILVDDSYYVFSNLQLFEIDLTNNSLRIAADLPVQVDFTTDTASVVEVNDNKMLIEITDDSAVTKYEINLSTREVKLVE